MEISRTLTIQEVADILKLSYSTVYSHRLKWGFFQMEGSRLWRVFPEDLEKNRKRKNNVIRLVRSADNSLEDIQCRSTNATTSIGLMSLPQVDKELDKLLGQP